MKNLLIILTLFFALGVNAQINTSSVTKTVSQSISPEAAAKSNLDAVNKFIKIDKKTQDALLGIFKSKYEILFNNKNMSAERKKTLSESISSQMETVLGKENFRLVKSNKSLYEKLIS
jgi:hypothetical protein